MSLINKFQLVQYDYYELVLFYPQQAIMLNTFSIAEGIVDNKIEICPNRKNVPDYLFSQYLYLWSPEEEKSFQDFDINFGIDPYTFKLLEDLTTEIDTQTFYETYLDPNTNACFEIDMDVWYDR